MKKRSELLFSLLQIPVDYLMLVLGFVVAFFIREGTGKPLTQGVSGHAYLNFMIIFLPLWLLIFGALDLYKLRADRRQWLDLGKIIGASAAGVMILIVIDFLSTNPIFPAKSIPIYGFIFATLFVMLGRLFMTLVQRICAHYGVGVYKILFIGNGQTAVELKTALKQLKSRYRLVQSISSLKDVTEEDLEAALKSKQIDSVLVTDNNLDDKKLLMIVEFCQRNHLVYQFAPTLAGLYTSKISQTQIKDIPILELQPTPLDGWGRILKRVFDVVITLIITLISLPFQMVIAILVKITDPGPVIYKHPRLGRNNKEITVYKFRTMRAKYCTGPQFGGRTDEDILKQFGQEQVKEFKHQAKLNNDPRVSKIGKFLRKTSLDELPQLWNILRGDLSLVGPRPIPFSEVELVGSEQQLGRILTIRPGLTGLWQVSGRNDLDYSQRTKLNIYYLENWSIWLDIKILFKTAVVVITERNGR